MFDNNNNEKNIIKSKLLEAAKLAIIDSDEEAAVKVVKDSIENDIDLIEILQKGFVAGNLEVASMFEKGHISLPELIFSSEIMKNVISAIDEIIPLEESGGRVIIATVEGDIHDIGKGVVSSVMKSYGIQVIDIGRNVPADEIIEAAQENNADIIATSALLTSTLSEQKKLEICLREKKIRKNFTTMVGGAPCTPRWARRINADIYTEDAVAAARKAMEILEHREIGRRNDNDNNK